MWGTRGFIGELPRRSDRRLDAHMARLAENCWLTSATVRPVAALGAATGTGTWQTIYRFSPTQWFAWDMDVDVVPAPVRNDTLRRTYWTGQDFPRMTDTTIMGAFVGPGVPVSRRVGIPAPTTAPTVSVQDFGAGVTATEAAISTSYVYTYVSDKGEEGPPSPVSVVVTRKFDTDGNIQQATLSNMERGPTGPYGVTRKRIYRAAASAFFLVAEIAVADETYVESILDSALGETIVSTNWDPPPADLVGLVGLTNGVMAAFRGREIYFSEPYQPHAWPPDYVQVAGSDIVGLGAFGTTVVAGTKGTPYLIAGPHPDNVQAGELELKQACVSKRSFAKIGEHGIVFASPDGLIRIGPGAAEFISRDAFALREWEAIGPADMQTFYHDNLLIMFLADSALAFSPADGSIIRFTDDVSAGYVDDEADELYVVPAAGGIREWRANPRTGAAVRTYRWGSGIEEGPKRCYTAAQVIAKSYPVDLRVVAAGVDANGNDYERTFDKTVMNRLAFRLAQNMTGSEWRYEVSGTAEVEEVRIGRMDEMLGA